MSEQQNLDVVQQQVYAAFGRGDIPTILNALAYDVDWQSPGPATIPWAGVWRGRDQVARWFTVIGETAEFEEFTPQEFFARGDKVMVLGYERFRIKSTGRTVANELAQVYMLHEGKIVRFREYYDTAALAEAFRGSGQERSGSA